MKAKRTIFALSCLVAIPGLAAADSVRFNQDIRPIISDKCFKCHGPDAKNQDSSFRLDTEKHAHADLGGYFGIVPGKPAKSELVTRIHSSDPEKAMPPPDSNLSLTAAEKKLLEDWIKQGAKFEPHWSLQPLPKSVAVPKAGSKWALNEIDRFIEAGFKAHGVGPAKEAVREKWLRRATFDLTGLPPSIEEIAAFKADKSPNAYEAVADRLLASPAYAERMTSEWLDLARYSDSYGYQRDDERLVWPWRDWVISSFAKNMPYDEFITLQIAGDLLPNATPEQVLPTAFNRLHGHVKEGGIVLEEYRVEYVADRTHTFATAFLGLTMECARCHDHKYDPLPTRDYYSLTSFFANVDESGLISYFTDTVPTPAMPLSTPEADAVFAQAEAEQAAAVSRYDAIKAKAADSDAFKAWLSERPALSWPGMVADVSFDTIEEGKLVNRAAPEKKAYTNDLNRLVPGKFGQALLCDGDGETVIEDVAHFKRENPFSVSIWLRPNQHSPREGIYSRSAGADDAASIGYEFLLMDGKPTASLIHFWPGDGLRVQAKEALPVGEWHHMTITYDGSSRAKGLKLYRNGEEMEIVVIKDRLTRQITEWINLYGDKFRDHLVLGQRYRDRGFVKGQLDELRVFDREITRAEARQLFDGSHLASLLAKDESALLPDERSQLLEYYLSVADEPAKTVREELLAARVKWNRNMDALPSLSIMRELPEPKPAYVLDRGAYDAHGEPVIADTPTALPPFPKDQPRNRLGLANWLTEPSHPLTARVTVNRYWQLVFGKGIVRTPEDFGLQGNSPTHPDLLDWLARDFVSSGWDVRHLLKQMVLSATYRQGTVIDAATRLKDPENMAFCRNEPKRLQAEMLRDNILAVSGLLVDKVGGPPARPYELAVGFQPVDPDVGDGLYRRSLYTRSKRNSPAPVMVTFDAPKRDVCTVKRASVASPLQPLIMLNGPQFTESSRVLAEKLLEKHAGDRAALIGEAFLRLTSRQPTDKEVALMLDLYQIQRTEFDAYPENADSLLKVGASPITGRVESRELAAATVVVNALINLNETFTHR